MQKIKILALVLTVAFLGAACGKKEEPAPVNKEVAPIENPVSITEPETSMTTTTASTTPETSQVEKVVTLKTNQGDIKLEFYPKDAPKAVANFIKLAESGFYDGVNFHRVIPGFMIQGGDPLSKDSDPTNDGTGGPGYMFEDELNPATQSYKDGYKKGVLAMANAGPNTNGSQFFIMLADYPLPNQYTIFGKVLAGQEVVDKIGQVKTSANDRPTTDVKILKALVEPKVQ